MSKIKYTAPQQRLLKEGELYGNYTKSGDTPIDQLINFVQSYFIDWDLNNPKFIGWFHKTHPSVSKEQGGMQEVILNELPTANQSPELIKKLIKKTEETGKPKDSVLDAPIIAIGPSNGVLDLSVRATYVLRDNGVDTIRKLISIPKPDMLRWRNLGRTTLRELEKRVSDFIDEEGMSPLAWRELEWYKITPEELSQIEQWVNSKYTGTYTPGSGAWTPKIH